MSDPKLEPLDPELVALLDAERQAAPPTGALDRVWARIALPAGVNPRSGSGSGSSGGWLGSHAVAVATAAFVAGGAVGAGVHAALRPAPVERVVYVDRPAPAPVAAPSATVVPSAQAAVEPSASPSPVALPVAHASVLVPAAPSASVSSLAAERGLLDDARGALGEGDPAKALALLDDHARRFPRGQLGEEREALAIQALVAEGRVDEAKARAARFRAASPNSLFLPAIEASVGAIP